MTENTLQEGLQNEEVIIHRGLVLFSSLLAGAALVWMLFLYLPLSGSETDGIVSFSSLGLKTPYASLKAISLVVGALLGLLLGEPLWVGLAHIQRSLSAIPVTIALKRAAVPFAVFLPCITELALGRTQILFALAGFGGLILGFFLLAWLEKKDKRKIFFAHPTESEYHPTASFVHGGVIALGAGLGWFLQSLPQGGSLTSFGLWLPLGLGVMFWILCLLLAAALNLIFSKITFDQVFLALALASLPLALLPLQTIGWYQYVAAGKILNGHQLTWLPVLLVGLAGLFSFILLVFMLWKLTQRSVEVSPAWEELFRALMLITAIPVLLYAVTYWPAGAAYGQVHLAGPVDMLQEGESLGTAQAILLGRLPFKEILFRHGFATDALGALVAWQWFGMSLESYRWLLTLLTPLGLLAIYFLAIFCLPWIWAIALILLVATGSLGSIPVSRFFFTLIGFIFTLHYLQRSRWIILLFSGFFSTLALMTSFTAGLLSLVGHLALLFIFLLFGGSQEFKRRLVGLGIYLVSTVLMLLPWMLYLALSGSLKAYLANFAWVLTYYGTIFGQPLSSLASHTPGEILWLILPPLASLGGSMYFLLAWRNFKTTGQLPWNVLLLLILTFLFWMRYLQLGEGKYLQEALPIAGMLVAFLLHRITARQRRLRGMIFLLLLPWLFLPQANHYTLTNLAEGFGTKNHVTVDGWGVAQHPFLRGAFLPAEQVQQLDPLAKYLEELVGSAEAFFDFSNQPLLYFLVPRRPVVSALSTMTLATFPQQLEAIHAITHAEVKAVICDGRPSEPATGPGEIPLELRQYALSEYVLQTFVPTAKIGTSVILSAPAPEIFPEPKAQQAMMHAVNMYQLPWRWGEQSKYDPNQGGTQVRWIPENNGRALMAQGLTLTAQGQAWTVGAWPKPIQLPLVSQTTAPQWGNVLVMDLKISPELDQQTGYLTWGESTENKMISFTLPGEQKSYRYVFRLGALASWVYSQPVKRLQLNLPAGGWTLEQMVLIQVKDIPELIHTDKKETKTP